MTEKQFTTSDDSTSTEVACVIYPTIKKDFTSDIDPEARLEEAVGLARAIHLDVVEALITSQSTIKPGTYISHGHVEEIKQIVDAQKIGIVIIDAQISPVQQRNLEEEWGCKVIDRTGLILEIFGERARTSEGKMQVELASLSYQRSRLVRSWTHLERQRGGFGFMGGPGESQLEIDKRLIDDRIRKIKKQLDQVKKTRGLHRDSRKRVPFPVVALVGYTNAGKSTLFNLLTNADVMAEDMLFATLDPTMRHVKLPSGREIILSDTVGFISDLPTQLVAAFRATLEEVIGADLILHVRDISSSNSKNQKRDVMMIIDELGIADRYEKTSLEVLNKIDQYYDVSALKYSPRHVPISALTGEGVQHLLEAIDDYFRNQCEDYHLQISLADGAKKAWLHRHGEVMGERHDDETLYLTVRMSATDKKRFDKLV